MGTNNQNTIDPTVAELSSIKQLLIVGLLRDGVSQRQIASALGVHESVISRSLPKGFAAAMKLLRDGKE